MKLNPKLLRYLTPEHFRVLTAVWEINILFNNIKIQI